MKIKTRQRLRQGLVLSSFLMFPVTMYYFSPALIIQGAAAVAAGGLHSWAGHGWWRWLAPQPRADSAKRREVIDRDWAEYQAWLNRE